MFFDISQNSSPSLNPPVAREVGQANEIEDDPGLLKLKDFWAKPEGKRMDVNEQ